MQLALSPVDAFMILYETVVEGARIDRLHKSGRESTES